MKVGGDEQSFTTNDTIDDEFMKSFVKSEWAARHQNSKFGTLHEQMESFDEDYENVIRLRKKADKLFAEIKDQNEQKP